MAIAVSKMQVHETESVRELLRECSLTVDLAREFERSWALMLVARLTARDPVAGFLLAWRAADELHLTDLGTRPDFRRRGVARALLGELIAHGKSTGARVILLEVRSSNAAALGLYASFAFQVSGERKGYYSESGEDAVEMRLDLR